LTGACAGHPSGVLRVTGNPGGVLHLWHGTVIAVDSPGAPDVATLLLRSGRITEAEWAAVFEAGAATGRIGAELVARTLVGAAELELMCQMAVLDGAFAVAAGRVDDCVPEHGPITHWLPAPRGVEHERLLSETERRLKAFFTSHQAPISPFHDRVIRTVPADRLEELFTDERREILQLLDGRRSARDIAFLIGRGVYAVTVEVSRMLDEGLVEVPARPADPILRPRSAGRPPNETPPPDVRLPRRRRGASGIIDVLSRGAIPRPG
jgi:hypothetical protein